LLFLFDDILEKAKEEDFIYMYEEALKIIERKPRTLSKNFHLNNFFSAQEDFVSRFYRMENDSHRRIRYVACFKDFLDGVILERNFVINNLTPTVYIKDFLEYRLGTVGIVSYCSFAETAANISDEDFQRPIIQELVSLTIKHCFLVNDLYSLEREKIQEMPNYVMLIAREKNLTEEQAKDYVLTKLKETTRANEIYQELQVNNCQKEILHYVEALIYIFIGNIEWSQRTERYILKKKK
jgi:hypothetical protein